MLLERNDNSTNTLHLYNLTDRKYIGIHTSESHEIELIRLFDENIGGDCMVAEYEPIGLWYLENFCHGMDNEALDTNLLIIVEEAFKETYSC